METNPHIRRRSVLAAGSAWAVPTIVVTAAAPAAAVSASCAGPCPSMGFGGSVNGNAWVAAKSDSFGSANPISYESSYTPWDGPEAVCTGSASGGGRGGTLSDAIVAVPDPVTLDPAPVIRYRKNICLTSGYTYSFTFDYNYYGLNRRAAYLDAALVTASGTRLAGAARISAPAARNGATDSNGRGSGITFSYPVTVSQDVQFVYTWSYDTVTPPTTYSCDRKANDIRVTAPRITCTKR